MQPVPPSRPIPVTFYPDYREMNPYQTLLYAGLEPYVEARPGTIRDALAQQARSQDGRQIFHLHWEHQALSDPAASIESFLNDLVRFRDGGGRIIWTLHNLTPHEPRARAPVADLYTGLISLVDIVQVHSLPAVSAAREVWSLPTEKIRIIPHANYAGAYPIFQRAAARRDLGLDDAGMVVLLSGRIARYKRPDALISAFRNVAGADDQLLVAGQFAKGVAIDVNDDSRVIVREGFASAEDVARFHAAADFVALPYAQSLTSGSAILAATLGRGVLGPDTPGLRDAVASGATGFLYDPNGENALDDALSAALTEGSDVWDGRGAAAAMVSQARDIAIVAAAWRDLIAALLVSPNHRHAGAFV